MFMPGRPQSKALLRFLLGAVCIILGGVPLLKLKLATTMQGVFSPMAIKIALLIGGLFLFYDGLIIKNPMTGLVKPTSMLGGVLLFIAGALPLLIELGWLNKHLPFIATLNIPVGVLYGLLIFFGLYLLHDGFVLSKQFF